jgi:hypothetical protein
MRILLGLVGVMVAGLAIATNAAAGGEGTQAYVVRVEPICRANTTAISHLLHGTRRMANHGRAVAAGRRFVRASIAFADTVRKVAAVHRPAPDAELLTTWLDRLRGVKEGLRKVGTALKQRNRIKALNRVGELRDAGHAANQLVAGFGFRYCWIRASRFS